MDGIATYLAPGRVLLDVRADSGIARSARRGHANLAALQAALDARGRAIDVAILDPAPGAIVPYANHYVVNGAVIVPLGADGPAGSAAGGASADCTGWPPRRTNGPLAFLATVYPDREVVGRARRGPRRGRRRAALHHAADPGGSRSASLSPRAFMQVSEFLLSADGRTWRADGLPPQMKDWQNMTFLPVEGGLLVMGGDPGTMMLGLVTPAAA